MKNPLRRFSVTSVNFRPSRAVMGSLVLVSLSGLSQVATPAETVGSKPCVIFIDDISSPAELKQHGIEPYDPDGLAYAFDAISGQNTACTLIYSPVRQEASRAIPVIIDVPENREVPPALPEKGLKLPDLQKAWLTYRRDKTAYDERQQAIETRRDQARQQFIVKSLDALASAEAELTALRRARSSYRASDIEGAILGAVATARTLRSSSVVLVLNTDLVDEPGHRRPRKAPFNEDELPLSLVRGMILVNTSYRPDSSVLISKTAIPKHHAQSLKAAADRVASLLPGIK
jgi:hypothetical protein